MRRLNFWALVALDVGLLLSCAGRSADLLALIRAAMQAAGRNNVPSVDDTALAAAGAGLWIAAWWLALVLLCASGAACPGRVGTHAGAALRRIAPRALRSMLLGASAASVALTSTAPAIAATPPLPATASHSAGSAWSESPGWPTGSALAQPVAPGWPTSSASVQSAPTAPSPRPAPTPLRTPLAARPVVVAAGDSLWQIAARHLQGGAGELQIARSWPRWYEANRQLIGSDPNLLRVGERLTDPDQRASS